MWEGDCTTQTNTILDLHHTYPQPSDRSPGGKYHGLQAHTIIKLLCLLVLGSCLDESVHTRFLIGAGKHYSTPRLVNTLKSNTLLFDARFDTDICEYDDLSKLYGFTDCNSTPLENSARFSFRQQNGIIEIFAFVHNNGAFSYKQVGTVKKDEWNNYKITIHDDFFIFIYLSTMIELYYLINYSTKSFYLSSLHKLLS